ncbi:MoaA/NifB/PqqE/SkfB family radical SAM enzyme [Pseudodesulfovibrio indicus]|uniref:MoaA/NifB/PqqE/SkfB family radical SAM enzyme n=2 Tax=Pseudodesulfovibrio indicus TaxID=1716143 RepID=A0A126QJJ4_9BACT|nr:radical SAM protein [Pseudodesulfovibrio indicus]AMK09927.1 radical SAM protein [Pseudodesulfovibrio indicus]TDT87392.1 MoaA/NifB/PqqE/SkfB family radical SAM enzyme [Pseudodesulfovibrio indicus]
MNVPSNRMIWNMTRKCNFRCEYCYFPHDNTPVTETLDAERISGFLDATGKPWKVGLTGGEPFIYPGIIDICETLTRNHVIGIDTNLSVSSKVREFAERIDPARVHNLYVALHIEERERIKGVDAFIRNARLLLDKGFEVIVNYVVHPSLEERFARDRAFFAEHGIAITPRPFRGEHEGRRYPEAYGDRADKVFGGHPEQGKKVAFNFQGLPCSAGRTLLRLEPDGTVFRCPGDKTVLGNVMDKVHLYEGFPPCTKKRCPCRGLDHVRLTYAQADLVRGVQYAVVAANEDSRLAFEQALAGSPGNPCAENNLGVLAWRRGERDEARQWFESALKLVPDNRLYVANLDGARSQHPDFDPQICLDVNANARPD